MQHPPPKSHIPTSFIPSRRSLRIALVTADLAHDTEMRQRLGAQAREKAHQHGWDGIVLRIEDLYAATMATANATPQRRVWAQARSVG